MVESFDWFTPGTYVDNSSNRKLLTSTLHNLYKKSKVVPFMEILLNDSCDLNKQDKQIEFPRQAVSLSVEIVQLEFFYQASCRLTEEICST